MRKWKYIGCICLIGLAVLGAYFLPRMTSSYTDRRAEGKVYTEAMQAFTSGRDVETVKERSRRVMDGVRKTGVVWGDNQDVEVGDFRKRVKKELQKMRAVGLLPDVFTWKWIGKARNPMTAQYWNLNEDIEDFGDLGLWHICASHEDMYVELDMDAATYKIYHVSICDIGSKLDEFNKPKRAKWEKGFESYYEFKPMETEKKVPNKALLWEDEIYSDEIYWWRVVSTYDKYETKTGTGEDKTRQFRYFVQGFSTLSDLFWYSDMGTDESMTYADKQYSYQQ